MNTLTWLVKHHLQDLTGAQFKLAACLFRRLQRGRPALTVRTKDLAKETGLSVGATQSASNHLAKQKILAVTGGPGKTKTYRFPPAETLPEGNPAKPKQAKPGAGSKVRARPRRQAAKIAPAPPPLAIDLTVPNAVKPKAKRVLRAVEQPPKYTVIDFIEQMTQEPQPLSAALAPGPQTPPSSAPPAAIKVERPSQLPRKIRPEPVIDPVRAAALKIEQEIDFLLSEVFRPVDREERRLLEESAGGKLQLLARLQAFKKRGDSFVSDNLNLFRTGIAYFRE